MFGFVIQYIIGYDEPFVIARKKTAIEALKLCDNVAGKFELVGDMHKI